MTETIHAIRTHSKPGLRVLNMQIWIQDYSDWDSLGHYKWDVGLSNYDGDIVRDWKQTKMGDLQSANEAGAVVFHRIMADPRGGAMTLVATKMMSPAEAAGGHMPAGPPIMMQTARYGAVPGTRLLFQVTPVRSSQTRTENDPTNKVTGGAKAGASGGIFSGEVSGSYEHGFRTGSTSDARQGEVVNMTVVWLAK